MLGKKSETCLGHAVAQRHEISNGLLLRSDLHRLFDESKMMLCPGDLLIVVSKCIREELENGKDCHKLKGQLVGKPSQVWARPTAALGVARKKTISFFRTRTETEAQI
jgi:hypothetical protein